MQLERELEGLRTRGGDLSAKQQEIEVARRAAKDAEMRYHEAHKYVITYSPSFMWFLFHMISL